jgi:hypothetical protein
MRLAALLRHATIVSSTSVRIDEELSMPVTVKRSRCGKLIVMWHTYLAGSKAFVLNRDMDAGTVEAQVRTNPSFASHVTREREALSRRTCASEQRRTSDCICLGSDEQGEVETEAGASSDDEVEEVAPPAPPPRITFAVEGDDEVQGMAAAGGLHDLPHLRGFCLHKPFVRTTASGRMRATPRHVATATASFAIDLQLSARSGKARNARPQVTATPTAATSSGGCCRGAPSGRATGPS